MSFKITFYFLIYSPILWLIMYQRGEASKIDMEEIKNYLDQYKAGVTVPRNCDTNPENSFSNLRIAFWGIMNLTQHFKMRVTMAMTAARECIREELKKYSYEELVQICHFIMINCKFGVHSPLELVNILTDTDIYYGNPSASQKTKCINCWFNLTALPVVNCYHDYKKFHFFFAIFNNLSDKKNLFVFKNEKDYKCAQEIECSAYMKIKSDEIKKTKETNEEVEFNNDEETSTKKMRKN